MLFRSGILGSSIESLDQIDIGFRASVKDFLKSNLFKVRLVYGIGAITYLGFLVIAFLVARELGISELNTVILWGGVSVIVNVLVLITLILMIRKNTSFNFQTVRTIKYLLITIVTCLISNQVLSKYLVYDQSIFVFGPRILPQVLLFIGMYFGIIFLVDKQIGRAHV